MKKSYLQAAACVALGACMAFASTASAKTVEVQELNQGADGQSMVFSPMVVHISPGDSVHFVATDKGHGIAPIDGMTPAGGTEITGADNADHTIKFTKQGVYGYQCKAHYGMGMVGLVVVGKPVNAAAAKTAADSAPFFAKNRLEKAFAEVDAKK
ncbi:MAG: pseudoazurin [Alphaproteobacteria bacterium]|nr:pseudoazurin [Alphaproteobacteria bacterium]